MTIPYAYAGTRLVRLACVKAIADNLADAYGAGGAFEDDPTKPSLLPDAPSLWGGPLDAIPRDGGFLAYPPTTGQQLQRPPYVWIDSVVDSGLATETDYMAVMRSCVATFRARVMVAQGDLDGLVVARATAAMAAESLAQAAAYCAMRYAGATARALDPTGALSLTAGGFVDLPSSVDDTGAAPVDGRATTSFDAIASIRFDIRLLETGGTP